MSTKIGTITFQASHNCGSLLQAYALQQTLKAMGYDNEIINFSNEGSRDMYSILPPIHLFRRGIRGRLQNWIRSVRYYGILKRQHAFYESFITNLKSATKLFSVLLASKRPLITELADKLRLKYPLLPTISPCPTMRLEAIRSIIPISCRRYPKSV